MVVRLLLIAASVCAALLATACSGSPGPRQTKTVYAAPSTPASVSPPSVSSSAAPVPTLGAPRSISSLAGRCEGKLSQARVATAIDDTLDGQTAFVVGEPDPSINRVGYINCRYGLSDPTANPMVEIQVSLYGTVAQAAARIDPTVTDYTSHDATAKRISVAGRPATVLSGGSGTDYLNTTLVMAYGQRTVVVGVSADIAADRQEPDLVALAVLALNRTA